MMTIEVTQIGQEELAVLNGMPMIVIYEKPSDFPNRCVARLWDICGGDGRQTEVAVVAETLDEVRSKIPFQSMYSIGRFPEDDPYIVEVWI